MRHLAALPVFCATLAACAAPAAPTPGATFTLERGQAVDVAPGVTLVFEAVDDSRCPPGMRCVQAGALRYRFSIRAGAAAPDTFTLSPGQLDAAPQALAGRRILLDEAALPAPAAPGIPIVYRATLRLTPTLPTP